jgi:hypothetical protein
MSRSRHHEPNTTTIMNPKYEGSCPAGRQDLRGPQSDSLVEALGRVACAGGLTPGAAAQNRHTVGWWAVTDLNRGPSRCKRDALTAELTAQFLLIVTDAERSVNADRGAPHTCLLYQEAVQADGMVCLPSFQLGRGKTRLVRRIGIVLRFQGQRGAMRVKLPAFPGNGTVQEIP